jgi:uncharacterized protein
MTIADPRARAIFLEALKFAAERHADQSRKGTSDPYVTHPVAVAELLAHYHPDRVPLIIAGLLHDVVEDTSTTLAEVDERFGPEVARLVDAVTKRPHLPSWEARLKLADCANNVATIARDLRDQGNAVWSRFKGSRAESLWYYGSVLETARAKLQSDPLINALQDALAALAEAEAVESETIIDWAALQEHVSGQFPMRHERTPHGPEHWTRVERIGLRLAEECGADRTVVRLFALFHDSRRENDYRDNGHGWRGARLAESLRGNLFTLDDERMRLLVEACEGHTDGRTSADPTVGACWDADRLDLMRVGMYPNPKFMSTAPAKRSEVIEWAVSLSQG